MAERRYATKQYFGWLTLRQSCTYSFVFIMMLIICLLVLDPDFGWHLAAGRYFSNQDIPTTDVFTYTAASFPWVDHEWLSDVLLYRLYGVGGYGVLAVLYAAMWTGSLWLVGRKVSGLVVILAALALLPFAGVRATTWTVLGLALTHTLVNAQRRHLRWLFPLLFLTWANVHGGFLAGLVLLAYYAAKEKSLQLAALLTVSMFTTLCNPYGIGMYIEIFRTLGDGSLHGIIKEWIPIGTAWQVIPYLAVWATGLVLTVSKEWRSYVRLDTAVLVTVLSGVRNYPLFIILSLPATGYYLHSLVGKFPKYLHKNQLVMLGGLTGMFAVLCAWSGYTIYNTPLDRETFFPTRAVAYLQTHPCEGRLFNDFNYGGYLLWKLPNTKVYIDGRMPSWELDGRKYLADYIRILNDEQFRRMQFAMYDVRCVMTETNADNAKMIKGLKHDGWREVVKTNGSVLLVK